MESCFLILDLGGGTPTSVTAQGLFGRRRRVTQGLFGRRPVTQALFWVTQGPQAKYARSPKAFSNSETVDTQGPKAQCPPRDAKPLSL